jgi:hypothetical protein
MMKFRKASFWPCSFPSDKTGRKQKSDPRGPNHFSRESLNKGILANVPATQDTLLLHGPKQDYILAKQEPVPQPRNEREILLKVRAVGLNPIDWKAP